MGIPNVLTIQLGKFFGVGISISFPRYDNKKVLDIYISLPFIGIGIYCFKNEDNNWL